MTVMKIRTCHLCPFCEEDSETSVLPQWLQKKRPIWVCPVEAKLRALRQLRFHCIKRFI